MTGCNLLNTRRDGRMASEFTSGYHVHIIVRQGEMRFSDGKQTYMSQMETNDDAARIFLRFLTLVQKDCRQQRDVAYYADLLCITPKYLSQVSRSVSGLPASEWITYYATFELVSLLRSSSARLLPTGRKNDQSKTLTEVADLMRFETASHFSRYVKKLLGKSPSQYREK